MAENGIRGFAWFELGEMRKGGAGYPSLGFYRQRAEHSRGSSLGRRGGNLVAWRACRSGMEATGGRGWRTMRREEGKSVVVAKPAKLQVVRWRPMERRGARAWMRGVHARPRVWTSGRVDLAWSALAWRTGGRRSHCGTSCQPEKRKENEAVS